MQLALLLIESYHEILLYELLNEIIATHYILLHILATANPYAAGG